MRGRYTSIEAKIGPVSPFGPLVFIAAMPLYKIVWFYPQIAALAWMLLEIVASSLFNMKLGMLVRKFMRGFISMFYTNKISATPYAWSRRHWPPLAIAFMLGLSVFPQKSIAEYAVTDSVRWDRDWETGAIGLRPEDVIEALCNGCPLDMALATVIPKDFALNINSKINPKKYKINFVAGRPWGMILQDIATNNDLSIEVMKHGSRVIIDEAPKNRGVVSVVSLSAKRDGFHDSKSWELIPGDTLKTSLERWVSREGWSLVFDVDPDVAIDVYARYEGNLIDAVESVMQSYKAVGVLTRAVVNYSYANNVIKVTLKKADDQ